MPDGNKYQEQVFLFLKYLFTGKNCVLLKGVPKAHSAVLPSKKILVGILLVAFFGGVTHAKCVMQPEDNHAMRGETTMSCLARGNAFYKHVFLTDFIIYDNVTRYNSIYNVFAIYLFLLFIYEELMIR